MFNGGPMLIEPLEINLRSLAPKARFIRLEHPPVVGAVLLGMDLAGAKNVRTRQRVLKTAQLS